MEYFLKAEVTEVLNNIKRLLLTFGITENFYLICSI